VEANIDGEIYDLDLTKTIELMRGLYKQMSSEQGIVGTDGKTYKLNRGLIRTAIKSIMTPFIIPMIERMYSDHDIILVKPERHADLIDYAVDALLDFMLVAGENTHVDFTSEIRENSRHSVKSIRSRWETGSRAITTETEKSSED
jgi:hypothetical protein